MSADQYRLQRFRDGWACAVYRDGVRISRRRLVATDEVAAIREIDALIAEDRRPPTPVVSWLWEEYRRDRAGRPIDETMSHTGKAILPHFGAIEAGSITKADCEAYVAKRRTAGRSDGAIWTELGHLRTVLQWACKRRIIEHAPPIERPKKPAPKDHHLTREQFGRLLASMPAAHARLFLVLAVTTAGRKEALLGLTWDRVDFERGLVILADQMAERRMKGRATVPMNATLRAALSEAKERARTPYVIEWAGDRVGSVRTALTKASELARISPTVTPHVLRHTAAVWMAESGVPMPQIAQYLGHADSRVTERVYARFSPTYLRGAADALETGFYEVHGGSHEPGSARGRRGNKRGA